MKEKMFLSTIFGDSNGLVSFDINGTDSTIERASARVQKDKLLNGTTYVKNHGVSEGDRIIEIFSDKAQSREVCANLWRLHRLNTKFLLSVRGEFLLGIIEDLNTDRGKVQFIFIPEQKF